MLPKVPRIIQQLYTLSYVSKVKKLTHLPLIFFFYVQGVTEERKILQFHYTEWHLYNNPFGNAVLEFRRRVRAVVGKTLKSEAGPMVVHCK